MENALTWLRRGQESEAKGSEVALNEAVRCYDEAIATLRRSGPDTGGSMAWQLGVAWMNRGNALQKQGTAASLAEALSAYDHAIAAMQSLPTGSPSFHRNSLGAAWMNRGLVLHRQATAESLPEAVRSQREAIAVLQTLPSDESSAFRHNLAAAWMNLGNALLDSTLPDRFAQARVAARESLGILASEENSDPTSAEIALKARRLLCDAIGQLLAVNTTGLSGQALAMEASDTVDEGLAQVRRWTSPGAPAFPTAARRLFYFGAQLYRVHQPQFLAEFLLEQLDPDRSPGAVFGPAELDVADEMLALALRDLRTRPGPVLDTPETDRRIQTLCTVKAAMVRLAELRGEPATRPPASP